MSRLKILKLNSKFKYVGIVYNTRIFMNEIKHDITWTIKVDQNMDNAVQELISRLGFNSKAEFTREAVREYLIRHRLYFLLGGEPTGPKNQTEHTPEEALHELSNILKKLPKKIIDEEIVAARDDVENAFFKE